ncbi:ATP-binding protein [Streptomyces sp. RFCAC02]|uniref:ATP-binding protein n=1 Tax=Streptomyces sp. RFCAC02 TaxID=2499143 RepID=UPI001F0CF7C6|nr:ATP-binding protein [Streptomyces sp. RFCAC02]
MSERLRTRLAAALAKRGIDGTAAVIEPTEPEPALVAAQERIPFVYRQALPEHPQVKAWVRAVADAAVPPHTGGLHPHYGARGRRQIGHGPSLLLWGGTGTGKTHTAYGAIRALTAAGCGVRWQATTVADLFAELRPRPGTDPEFLLRRTVRVPLLLLDDLGAARGTAWTEEILFRLVNWRCQHRLPTLFTTNLPPVRSADVPASQPVLRDAVGDRVLSRLSGMCTPIRLTGPDRRFQRH